jgi:biotin carboxyl carrier protein
MKMENEIVAHDAGRVEEIAVAPGDQVTSGELLIRIV